jgi:hypothetical protein
MSDILSVGTAPKVVGEFFAEPEEMMFYLYMPVMMPNGDYFLPQRLHRYKNLLAMAVSDYGDLQGVYVYITAKTMFVEPGLPGNRPGWHIDGFGSGGDINYVWADMNPTEYAVQTFGEISSDDQQSMVDMAAQIKPHRIVTYPDCTLLRLDESVVHRVNPAPKRGIRSFVKITISRHQFRNAGNSHNFGLNYSWVMTPRKAERNLDHG